MFSKLIIGAINLYQENAPMRIRMSCRFEPSCSNYMKMAIVKYGAIQGVRVGVNRFFRCKVPNGGVDYP
jgi:hypothetical protein